MKRLIIILLLGILPLLVYSQPLKFNKEKKFKIAQFTDLHTVIGDKRSDVVFENFKSVIEREKPDLIIVTGDMIYSGLGADKFEALLTKLNAYNIPFTFTFGNHDRQFGSTLRQLFEVGKRFDNFVGESSQFVEGVGNHELEILSNDEQNKKAILYCFDSHENSQMKPKVEGYDYIKRNQIEWYIELSNRYKSQNGGAPLFSLSFFHIPLVEYADALKYKTSKGESINGVAKETPCNPVLNSGLFTAFVEQGDVKGVFVGHDHDNDFAIPYYGILLAYGRFSGGSTEYFNLDTNGARIIELTQDQQHFETWVRLRTGEVLNRIKH